MIPLAVSLFFGVIVTVTGPAFEEYRREKLQKLLDWKDGRQARLDAPKARIHALPPGSCRPRPTAGWCRTPGCAICTAKLGNV